MNWEVRTMRSATSYFNDAHVVADVLQLPQVVGAYQHRGPPLGHVPHEEGPHLQDYAVRDIVL